MNFCTTVNAGAYEEIHSLNLSSDQVALNLFDTKRIYNTAQKSETIKSHYGLLRNMKLSQDTINYLLGLRRHFIEGAFGEITEQSEEHFDTKKTERLSYSQNLPRFSIKQMDENWYLDLKPHVEQKASEFFVAHLEKQLKMLRIASNIDCSLPSQLYNTGQASQREAIAYQYVPSQ